MTTATDLACVEKGVGERLNWLNSTLTCRTEPSPSISNIRLINNFLYPHLRKIFKIYVFNIFKTFEQNIFGVEPLLIPKE